MFRTLRDQCTEGLGKKRGSASMEDFKTPRNCEICDAMYYTETEVEVHKQTVHPFGVINSKIPTCYVCTKMFRTEKHLIEHVKSFHLYSSPNATRVEQPIFVCDICSRIFFIKALLIVHMYSRHRIFNMHDRKTCPLCKRKVLLTSMWYHMETHCTKSVSACHLCLKNYGDRAALAEHIKTHTGYYYCEMCSYITTKCNNYHQHLADSHKPTEDAIDYCKVIVTKYFVPDNRKVTFKYRVQFVTSGLDLHSMLHICVFCREICKNTKEMAQHILLHQKAGKVEKKADQKICSCGETFTTDILLKHHIFKLKGSHKKVNSLDEVLPRLEESFEETQSDVEESTGNVESMDEDQHQEFKFLIVQSENGELLLQQEEA